VVDLSKLNNMYRISLAAFMSLFEKSLKKAPHGGSSPDKRIAALKQTLQDMVPQRIISKRKAFILKG
jgi:hypothetical protein